MLFTAKRIARHLDRLEPRRRAMVRNGIIILLLWITCMGLILTTNPEPIVMVFFGLFIPFAILFYTAAHNLFKRARTAKYPFISFLLRSLLYLATAIVPFGIILLLLLNDPEAATSYAALNAIFQLFITTPVAWYWYKRQSKGEETITGLQKELGQSEASFDFLRSQINPHFLFNALNTIYGTALQENAVRTSEGIEKLGDMMRFMLEENMKEKIPLVKELQYLDDYIALQKLRIGSNPAVTIEADIVQQPSSLSIAPMLLIPFVENAFKHGISFRQSSFITIGLELKDHSLLFEVSNSKPIKDRNDPEKERGGIGLTNVRQRLQLLYPNRHQLIIKEKDQAFLVHLTLQLQ
jgi:two-component system, LytTR family, sensor kinase